MDYEISEAADEDLKDIYKYTYRAYGEAQADNYYDTLITRVESLAASPRIARERAEFSPPVRIHPHGRHLIVYRVLEGSILIVRVLHQSMDIERQF